MLQKKCDVLFQNYLLRSMRTRIATHDVCCNSVYIIGNVCG